MNKFRTVAVALEGTEDLDLPPSPFVVAERFSINRAISVLALRLFSSEEIAKLALATDFTLRDLLGAQERLRDTLWIRTAIRSWLRANQPILRSMPFDLAPSPKLGK
jgi:hypothetical protein